MVLGSEDWPASPLARRWVSPSVGAWVETGASVDAGAAVPDDTWVGVGTSSVAGVVSEQAVRVAKATRRVMVASRSSLYT